MVNGLEIARGGACDSTSVGHIFDGVWHLVYINKHWIRQRVSALEQLGYLEYCLKYAYISVSLSLSLFLCMCVCVHTYLK